MRRAAAIAIAAGLGACGHSQTEMPKDIGAATYIPQRKLPNAIIVPAADPTPPGLVSHPLIDVPEQGIGPFLARRGEVVMAAFVGTSEQAQRRVVAIPLMGDGEARGDAKVIAPLASDATALVLRPMGGAKPGFLAAWASLADRGESLSVVAMNDDARARGEPIEIARTTEDIAWIGAVPTRAGAIVAWAEQTRDAGANVVAAAIAPDGSLRGVPTRIARDVSGWQIVATREGAGLALVSKKTSVAWLRLDADARPLGAPITLVERTKVAGNVDAAASQGGALVAWTDGSQADPQPVVARVDEAGHVIGPKRATEGGAGGTLVAVAPGAIAWEAAFRRGGVWRQVMLARVATANGALDVKAPVPLAIEGRDDPELAAVGDGLAILASTRACATNVPVRDCETAPVLPTYVRFDAQLGVAQVEPLRFDILREPASVGWSLSCGDAACTALAVTGEAPRVVTADLAPRKSGFRAPVVPAPPADAPTIEAIETLSAGSALADLAATRVGDGAMMVTLTAGSQQAKRDDASAVTVRAIAASGAASAPVAITKRALPVGGAAIAGTGRAEDGAAIAWVARDAGDPQVHVTRVDARGKVLHDVQLTSVKGDASDVAIAWTGEQWIVGWVDARDGQGEVYAATLDESGRRFGKGQRITNAPGDASDVALLATPDAVWIAWADPRESPQDGFADVYVAPLNASTAARAAEETRVMATAAHSRSPVLAARGKDVALAWIEEAPMGADANRARSYGAMVAWLGPSGRPLAEPSRVPVAGDGFPGAIALDASTGVLRAVLARAAGEAIAIDALELARDGAKTPFPLLTLEGPPSLDVALSVVGASLFYNDEGPDAEARRARRATIRWHR